MDALSCSWAEPVLTSFVEQLNVHDPIQAHLFIEHASELESNQRYTFAHFGGMVVISAFLMPSFAPSRQQRLRVEPLRGSLHSVQNRRLVWAQHEVMDPMTMCEFPSGSSSMTCAGDADEGSGKSFHYRVPFTVSKTQCLELPRVDWKGAVAFVCEAPTSQSWA
eukprot:4363279-Amphidinium_carterae.1